jgi:hypothetical protein
LSDCYFRRASRRKAKVCWPAELARLSSLYYFYCTSGCWGCGYRVPNTSVCSALSRCVIRRPPLHVLRVCDASQPPFVPFRGKFFSLTLLVSCSRAFSVRFSSVSQSRSVGRFVCERGKGEGAHGVNTAALGRALSRRDRSPATTREPGHPVVCVTLARGASSAVTWALHFSALRRKPFRGRPCYPTPQQQDHYALNSLALCGMECHC